jgi:hypothetical protein
MDVLVGTADGLYRLAASEKATLAGHRVDAIARGKDAWWVLTDGTDVWNLPDGSTPSRVGASEDVQLNCMLPGSDELLLGAEAGQLFHLPFEGGPISLDEPFARAPGRDDWYTPWGGPPDVRSLAADVDGTIYLNVHVGGILRFRRNDPIWLDTMDIDADVHEVIAHPDIAGTALAATARGLSITRDGADHWSFQRNGLHANYCRAVAVAGDRVFVSASRSNRGEQAAIYRTDLVGDELHRCEKGLPEWFSSNIDTGCLQTLGDLVLAGDADGTVYRSADAGEAWSVEAEGLPPVRCVALA